MQDTGVSRSSQKNGGSKHDAINGQTDLFYFHVDHYAEQLVVHIRRCQHGHERPSIIIIYSRHANDSIYYPTV